MDGDSKVCSEASATKVTEQTPAGDVKSDLIPPATEQPTAVPRLQTEAADPVESLFTAVFFRSFDEWGLWTLILTFSFLAAGLTVPWLLCNNLGDGAFACFVLLIGSLSSASAVTTLCAWFVLSRCGISGVLRFVVALWLPVLLMQQFKDLPGCLMTPSKSMFDYGFYYLLCLVTPALIGSTTALIGLRLRKNFFPKR